MRTVCSYADIDLLSLIVVLVYSACDCFRIEQITILISNETSQQVSIDKGFVGFKGNNSTLAVNVISIIERHCLCTMRRWLANFVLFNPVSTSDAVGRRIREHLAAQGHNPLMHQGRSPFLMPQDSAPLWLRAALP